MQSNREPRGAGCRRRALRWSSRLVLGAVCAMVLAGCASRLAPLSKAGAPTAAVIDRGAAPASRDSGLGVSRLKRRVYLLEQASTRAPAHGGFTETGDGVVQHADERALALQVALERALVESGRYEMVKTPASAGAGMEEDAIRMSVEMEDSPQVMTVRLRIHEPRSTSPALVFSGEGVTVQHRTGVFSRADEEKARAGALQFAVTKALRNASAVLGSLPWQAPVLKATDDDKVLIPDGRRLGLKPGVVLSIQTRERVLQGVRAPVAVPGRLVGEVRIVGHEEAPGRETMAVGEIVSGSLKGYDPRELVVRFCKPKGYFGHDFGHDRQCGTKAAALVSFDPETALLSFSPEAEDEAEFHPVPHEASPVERPSAVF